MRGEGSDEKGPLLLNYCVTGRCEIILNNGNFVYVTDGDLSLTEHFAQRQYVYPRRIYEGLEFFAELDTLAAQSVWLLEEFGLDFTALWSGTAGMEAPTSPSCPRRGRIAEKTMVTVS